MVIHIGPEPSATGSPDMPRFVAGLKELGHVDRETIRLQFKYVDNDYGLVSSRERGT